MLFNVLVFNAWLPEGEKMKKGQKKAPGLEVPEVSLPLNGARRGLGLATVREVQQQWLPAFPPASQ